MANVHSTSSAKNFCQEAEVNGRERKFYLFLFIFNSLYFGVKIVAKVYKYESAKVGVDF